MAGSASASENHASSSVSGLGSSEAILTTSQQRSCTVCRTRKVRCDRKVPCSNCRRANIACVYPESHGSPRWARRFQPQFGATSPVRRDGPSNLVTENDDEGFDRVLGRLQNLESLVNELRDKLKHEHATSGSEEDPVPRVQTQLGRLVLHDLSRSRYLDGGFWAKVNDELDGLQNDLAGADLEDFEASETLSPSSNSNEDERRLWGRHALIFRHAQTSATLEIHRYHPPSLQRQVLLDIFAKNINLLIQMVHMPAVSAMLHRTGYKNMSSPNDALMFSIYYAAVASLDDDEVLSVFDMPKSELILRYRSGLEIALAKGDILNNPDITVVQALLIFLFLSRGSESPTYIWMLTGLVVRMAQSLGLHRDGTHFQQLTPYEIQMRRRIWWLVLNLDLVASEDEGIDLFIASDTFDTNVPLNLNSTDIDPETQQMPGEREGLTDISTTRVFCGSCQLMRQMMATSRNSTTSPTEQSLMLDRLFDVFERGFLQYTDSNDMAYRFTINVVRITMAKMTLIVFLPILFASPGEQFTNEIRIKLLISAIEVAEYNHALHIKQEYNQWRWICQTYTHWHAIVFILIEIVRRPWSRTMERAWVALHSPWLIPAKNVIDKNARTWIPLRRLIARARMHRENELHRLRADSQTAAQLEVEDQKFPLPSSPELVPPMYRVGGSQVEWRHLVSLSENIAQADLSEMSRDDRPPFSFGLGQSSTTAVHANTPSLQTASPHYIPDLGLGFGSIPWLWADNSHSTHTPASTNTNFNQDEMELDGDIDWHDWIQSTSLTADNGSKHDQDF